MNRRITILSLVAVFSIQVAFTRAQDTPTTVPSTVPVTQPGKSADARFLRFVGDGTTGGKLQTSEVTLVNDKGVTVHLVSAVHIGQAEYFHELQRSFVKCDAVLYEMVKPKEMEVPEKGHQSDHPIAKLQRFLKDTLNLSFQLDEVDYSPKNFIHADLDAETFQKMQSERGESFASLMLSSMLRAMTDPAAVKIYPDDPTDLMDFMTRPDGENQLKLLLARRLGDIEHEAMGLDMLNGTVILTERNKAVTNTLKQAIQDGHKNIAIFYGAAHMTDLSDRLDLMGFKPTETIWHTAWDVHIRPDAPSAFMKMMGKVQEQLKEQ